MPTKLLLRSAMVGLRFRCGAAATAPASHGDGARTLPCSTASTVRSRPPAGSRRRPRPSGARCWPSASVAMRPSLQRRASMPSGCGHETSGRSPSAPCRRRCRRSRRSRPARLPSSRVRAKRTPRTRPPSASTCFGAAQNRIVTPLVCAQSCSWSDADMRLGAAAVDHRHLLRRRACATLHGRVDRGHAAADDHARGGRPAPRPESPPGAARR